MPFIFLFPLLQQKESTEMTSIIFLAQLSPDPLSFSE